MVQPKWPDYSVGEMVDLARSEAQMLSEIEFVSGCGVRETTPAGTWHVVGRTPGELMPALKKTFSDWYADLGDEHVSYDLIAVVKKGLGNAYKWGNKRDQQKQLAVTAVLTGVGAVIKISDEGEGFDVPRVIRDRLFTRKGSGFHRFHKTTSVISYADGGRTFLIRFLCDDVRELAGEPATIPADPTPAGTRAIDLSDLRPCDQVKVKGILEPGGTVRARKVTVRPPEEFAVIEAPLQDVAQNGRVIRLMNLDITLAFPSDVVSSGLTHGGFDRPQPGQVVRLTGTYVPGQGLAPVDIRIRPGQTGLLFELRGRIESISADGKTFRLVGIAVTTDDHTELRKSLTIERES